MKTHHSFNSNYATIYGVDEAIMLDAFLYWIGLNQNTDKNFFDGRYWTYNSQDSLTKFFPFWSRKQVMRVLNSLIEKGVLLSGNYNKTGMDRTLWYAFSDEFLIVLNGTMQSPKQDNPLYETEHSILPNGTIHFPKQDNILYTIPNTITNTLDDSKNLKKSESVEVVEVEIDESPNTKSLPLQSSANRGGGGGKRKPNTKPLLTLFRDSEIGEFQEFEAYIKEAYPDASPNYYYNAILRWSSDKNEKRANWKLTVGTFVRGDFQKGKLITINHQSNGNAINLQFKPTNQQTSDYAAGYLERRRQRASQVISSVGDPF